jgi:hypothetical protein
MSTHSLSASRPERLAGVPRESFVRGVLKLDALVTGANGAVYLLAAGAIDSLLGVPRQFLGPVGVFLLAFAAVVWYLATRKVVRRPMLLGVAAANIAWMLASIVFLVAGWHSPSTAGVVWTALQAGVVALFAALQLIASRYTS